MLLSKIMDQKPVDALSTINSQVSVKYQSVELEAMAAVARAVKEQNLKDFERAKDKYQAELQGDSILHTHIENLYHLLLENNLLKILEPYSEVQISYVAEQIGLPNSTVQSKLSEMILDEKIKGTLDRGGAAIIIFEEVEENKNFNHTIDTFDNLDKVIDSLYLKSKKLAKGGK